MRDLAEKGSVPVRYWALWWAILAAAVVVFYVLLTPVWFAIRGAAWVAEFQARRRALT
ncbi:MAG: hypothetical protein ACRDN6_02240 [Gaiellaceae bacterium]